MIYKNCNSVSEMNKRVHTISIQNELNLVTTVIEYKLNLFNFITMDLQQFNSCELSRHIHVIHN